MEEGTGTAEIAPETTSKDRTRSLKIERARHSHDLETSDDHGIVPEKYGRIYVLDHSETDVFCTFIKVSSSSKCARDQSFSFLPY